MSDELPPLDSKDRWKYSDEQWVSLARQWAEREPELKSAVDELRKQFPGSIVTYIGPRR